MSENSSHSTRSSRSPVSVATIVKWTLPPALLLVLLLDSLTPLGFAHGLLYTPLVVISLLTRTRKWVVGVSILAAVFTLVGLLLAPPPAQVGTHFSSYVLANRFFSILVITGLGSFAVMILSKVAILHDAIRTQHHLNERLAINQRLINMASHVGNLGGWSVDLKTETIAWSDEVAFIHGMQPGEAPSLQEGINFYIPEHQNRIRKAYMACAEKGEPFDEELQIQTTDNRRVWIRAVGRAVRDESGRITSVEGALQDITHHREMEASFEASERRLKALADSMPMIVWAANKDGVVDFQGQPLVDYTGLPAAQLAIPGYWVNLIHPDDLEETLKRWNHCVATGDHYEVEFRIRRHDGEYHWFLTQAVPMHDAEGNITRWFGSSTDIHGQKQLELEASQLARRLANTLESITDAFLIIDREWCFSFLNSRAEELLGRSREELVGRNIYEAFPAAKGSQFEEEYSRAMDSGVSTKFEAYYPEPLDAWFDVSAYPTSDGLAVYFDNVTARRQKEAELRLLKTCVEHLNDIVLIAEASDFETSGTRIVFVNSAFEKQTGYLREEVRGKSPRILQGPQSDPQAIELIRNAMRENKPVRVELINYKKDGGTYWADVELSPIFNEKGERTHFVAIERDITDRKKAEEELIQSRQRIQYILNSVGEGIHGLDLDGKILFENPAAAEMFGWHESEIIGQPSHSLIHHHRADGSVYPVEECPIHRTLRDGEPRRITDEVFFRKDGSPFPVEYYCCPMLDSEGRIMGAVMTFRDVSEQRTLEEQLRQSQRLESVGQLTGGMAHDFNNLLTVIQGNADLLMESLLEDQELHALARMIATASQRGAELTHRLLAFARRQPLDPKAVDVNKLVMGLESLLRRTLGEHIEIELVRGAGLWRALVDPAQLESALLNLAINARDAMPDGGSLTIETANFRIDQVYADQHPDIRPGQYILIAVSDRGTGIPREHLDKVFEPFYTTKETGKGTGLGLSMVYGFVKQSRGHIKLYSEPGEGTTVKIYLPRVTDPSETNHDSMMVTSPVKGHELILLVEDDELVRQFAQSSLGSLGYQILIAEDGPRALEIIQIGRAHV